MLIATARFLLRDFTDADRAAFRAYHADLRYVSAYTSGPPDADALLERFAAWAAETPRRNFQLAAVRRAEPEILVGCCGLRCAEQEEGRAELGIELAPDYWGRHGYALEILRALGDFGFGELGLREIVGVTTRENARVTRLAGWLDADQPPADPRAAKAGNEAVEWRIVREDWEKRWRLPVRRGLGHE